MVCRSPASKGEMFRFVKTDEGDVIFDVRQRAPGRGVYVCARERCLEGVQRGGFQRGFKTKSVRIPEGLIEEVLRPGLDRVYGELLSRGFQSGQLVAGAEQVERAAAADALVAYLIAVDASAGTRRKYEENARRKDLVVLGLRGRVELGRAIGRPEAVVLGWHKGQIGARFAEIEGMLRALGPQSEPHG